MLVQLGLRKTLRVVEMVKRYDTFFVTCDPSWAVVEKIIAQVEKQNVTVLKSEVNKQENLFHVTLVGTFTGHEFQNITKDLLEMPEVHSLYQ